MKKSIFLITFILLIIPLLSWATPFEEMIKDNPTIPQPIIKNPKPFKGEHKNINWTSITPDEFVTVVNSTRHYEIYSDRGQVDEGKIDLDGDGQDETIKVIWRGEVDTHSLTIEVYKDNELIETLNNDFGTQPNYKIEDVDGDKKQEIIIWSGRWDFRTPGDDGIPDENYEGFTTPHKYIVATYKLVQGGYSLWDIYTTKEKYEPFVEEQPR